MSSISFKTIEPYLQPFYSCYLGRIVGCEVLVRGTEKNPASAGAILKYFASRDELVEMDMFMLEKICRYVASLNVGIKLAEMPTRGNSVLTINNFGNINVNISAETIRKPDSGARIISILKYYGVISRIVIEINEESAWESISVRNNLYKLIESGTQVSFDDFNYMSGNFDALCAFQVMQVKLKQFGPINQKIITPRQYLILRHMCRIFSDLNLQVVIEGVETAIQLSAMQRIGYDIIQGYYISKPIPLREFTIERLSSLRLNKFA